MNNCYAVNITGSGSPHMDVAHSSSYTDWDSCGSDSPNEGAVFSYFSGGGNAKRIARYNGQADYWWLRSPETYDYHYPCCVYRSGDVGSDNGGVYVDSGGRNSPITIDNIAYFVNSDGYITYLDSTGSSYWGYCGLCLKGYDW